MQTGRRACAEAAAAPGGGSAASSAPERRATRCAPGHRPRVLALWRALALALLCGAYAMWPPHLFSTPLAEITFAMLLRAVASIVLLGIGIEFLGALAIVTQSDR